MKKWRKKVAPLVHHKWTENEYKKLSSFEFYRIMNVQMIYFGLFRNLFSKDFLSVFSLEKDRTFFMNYMLHRVLEYNEIYFADKPYKNKGGVNEN